MIIHGHAPYLECSSAGDKRFSAFYAQVNGKSIEEQFQSAKRFSGSASINWRQNKARRADNPVECAQLYTRLWDQYIDENPKLLRVLIEATGLADMYGQRGHCCQATELWRIRENAISNPPEWLRQEKSGDNAL